MPVLKQWLELLFEHYEEVERRMKKSQASHLR